eukprot:SAG31_NODE_5861_length_2285_cov_1.991766_3_plen_357_part_00
MPPRLLLLLTTSLAPGLAAAGVLCAGTACLRVPKCPPAPDNSTQWHLVHQTVDGQAASNILLLHPGDGLPPSPGTPPLSQTVDISCAGANQPCHMWGAGFGDRNGFFLLDGTPESGFTVKSWPDTKSFPVGPNQTPPNHCLTAVDKTNPPTAGIDIAMVPCSDKALTFKLTADHTLEIVTKVPVAAPLCLGAPPPPPQPPKGRPSHWFSCTLNLAGGSRLPYPFCNASLPEEERLDDLLARATCKEKSEAVTSSGASIDRLGVPLLGAAEDTHGVGGGCIPADLAAPNSTGCPTTFPNGPGLGATFDRSLWREIGATIGREARGLNNMRVGPLYFLDPECVQLTCICICMRHTHAA